MDQWVNANIRFSHKGSLFPIFNQQQSVICFSMSVSLLCYDNLMRYLVAEETKASPGGTKTAFEQETRQAYSHQEDRNTTRKAATNTCPGAIGVQCCVC